MWKWGSPLYLYRLYPHEQNDYAWDKDRSHIFLYDLPIVIKLFYQRHPVVTANPWPENICRICTSLCHSWNILWCRAGFFSYQNCQENIRETVFWPWPIKNFLASFNVIMKAWTATNSQIGTKPVWQPHPLLPLSKRLLPVQTYALKHMVGGSRRSLCLCMWACPSALQSVTPTYHMSHYSLHQVLSTMFLLRRGNINASLKFSEFSD